MRGWLIAALAGPLLIALTPPPEPPPATAAFPDQAGNWSLPFDPVGPAPLPGEGARACTADRTWCAELAGGGESEARRLDIFEEGRAPRRLALPGPAGEESGFGLGPRLVREAGGAALIAVHRRRWTSYSGGGAGVTDLVLVRAEAGGGPAALLLDVPMAGGAMIRACFSEREVRARRGACHDEYALAGDFRLDPATREGRPRFLLTAEARTYPGRRARFEDSTAGPPLRRSDLVWAPDPRCSYRRRFAFDPATGRYVPDRPLPDCPDYFDL